MIEGDIANVQNVAGFGHVGDVFEGVIDFEGVGSVEDAENKEIVVGEVEELEKFDDALNLVVVAVVVEYVVGELACGTGEDMSHVKGAEDAGFDENVVFAEHVALESIEVVGIVEEDIEIALGIVIEGYTGPADHSEVDEHVVSIEAAGFVVGTEAVKHIDFEEDIGIEGHTGTGDYIVFVEVKEIVDSSGMDAVDIAEDFVNAAYVVDVVGTGNRNIADEEGTFQDFAFEGLGLCSLASASVAPHKACISDNPCYPFSSYWDPFYRIIVRQTYFKIR